MCFRTVFSTHRHPASTYPAHLVSVLIRHPSGKSSAVTSFETDIYLHRKCNKIYAVYSRVASVGCFPGAWRRGSWHFKSPVCTYNQAWTFSLSASHYFRFLSKRRGRRMLHAARGAKRLLNTLRSRPLRRICSTYPSTSQPFSVRNCRREN